jgi:membrane-bound lytic murein transglycosylase B
MRRIIFLIIFLTPLCFADYSSHDDVKSFIKEMHQKHDFDQNYLISIFSSANKQQKIIDLMNRPAEKIFSWDKYRKRLVSPMRIENGQKFLSKYMTDFIAAEKEFGVPKEIIASIIGIESSYGSIKGSTRVIDSLATLSFDYPRRSKFFKIQLENFDPLKLNGSYAGAMGYGQFLPDSYRRLAIDFDGDGVRDIINNPVDAIGSVANYLKRNGWQKDANIAVEANLVDKQNPISTIWKMKKNEYLELKPKNQVEFDDLKSETYLQVSVSDKSYWIGGENLKVLSRYNKSSFYIIAVFLLSKELAFTINEV